MFGIGTPLLVMYGLGSLLVLLGGGTFLFQAGCALADAPERGYLRSLPIHAAAVAICLPLAAVLVWFAGTYDTDPTASFGAMRMAGLTVSLVLTWLLSAGLYSLFLAASLKKGLVIAGVELLLMVLLAALVSAVVLVVLAVVQIFTRPPPPAKQSAFNSQLLARPASNIPTAAERVCRLLSG
jgi:hypothetical protein